jgi:hypothetical protein
MIPNRQTLIACLYSELDKRTQPLPITVGDDRALRGIENGFNDTLDYSCVFEHAEGDIEIGFNCPERRTLFGAETPTFAALNYEAKEAFLQKQADRLGFFLDELDPPWTLDAEDKSDAEALEEWLAGRFGEESEDEQEYLWTMSAVGEFLPGFAILDRLPKTEIRKLGMKVTDIGGPGSSVMAVIVKCPLEELNAALVRNRLPFNATASDD